MKRTLRIILLVLVVVVLVGCISVFARGTTYPCNHSYAESYASGNTAYGVTKNSQGNTETQEAYVYGKYKIGSDATTYSYYGNYASGTGRVTSTYRYAGSSSITYTTVWNAWRVVCPTCHSTYSGTV